MNRLLAYRLAVMFLVLSIQSLLGAAMPVKGEPEGWQIDVYTQKLPHNGKGLGQPSDAFMPQETVLLYASVTYNRYPLQNIPVSFYVKGPPNPAQNLTYGLSAVGNEAGIAESNFTIPWLGNNPESSIFGTWTVEGYMENATDFLTFEVGWIVDLTSLSVVFQDPPQGGFLGVQVALSNIAMSPLNVTLSLTWFDSKNFIIGSLTVENLLVNVDGARFTTDCRIPRWATPGEATLRVLASRLDGLPYSPGLSTTFWISIIGDLNNDNKVDIFDVSTAALAFGSYPKHPRWNPIADVNKDGKVDILDLAIVARNFGEFYSPN